MNYNDFSCPVCKHRLKYDNEILSCECGNKYYLIDKIPDFLFENKNETEMKHYFNSVSNYYESTPYLSKLYSFYGEIFTYPHEIIVPMINKSIDDGIKSI